MPTKGMHFRLTEEHITGKIKALKAPREANKKLGTDSYSKSYPSLLKLFEKKSLDRHLFIQGCHMAYGWMPTVLNLDNEDLNKAVITLKKLKLKKDEGLTSQDWKQLQGAVNRSLVGASKLGHFIAPDRVAIWDSRIVKYLVLGTGASTARPALNSRAARVGNFIAYQNAMRAARCTSHAGKLTSAVKAALGYEVSELRAIELSMFYA